jgi:hypothetical protein
MKIRQWTIKKLVDELVCTANRYEAWDVPVDLFVGVKVPEQTVELRVQAALQNIVWDSKLRRVVLVNEDFDAS